MKNTLLNKIKEREILKNCCIQEWASKEEKDHWMEGIRKYDIEIFHICEITGENEYQLRDSLVKEV